MTDLTVIILSYNTKKITLDCLSALFKTIVQEPKLSVQVIVLDNASSDDSFSAIQAFSRTHIAENLKWNIFKSRTNLGFVGGNNRALTRATGAYILYLNSDVIIETVSFTQLLSLLNKEPNVAGLTVRVELPGGSIDPASHRGFPTPWNAFCYYAKLEKMFGSVPLLSRIFGGYHLTYRALSTIHEIDAPSGAFFFVKRSIVQSLGGFDEDYFMYGEDIDLAYRIKLRGYKIWYYPQGRVLHLKYSSGLKTADKKRKQQTRRYFFEAMRIFYRKHYEAVYPPFINRLVYWGISVREHFR